MLEKWLLVFIIVGCTSLVFIICFPIDFYLYRRRKKLARERVNMCMYKPPAATRAGQMRSYVSMDVSIDDHSEYVEKSSAIDEPTQSRFIKLVNLFRKQKAEKMFQMRKLSLTTSEIKSDVPTLALTAGQISEFERSARSSVSSKCIEGTVNQSFDHNQKIILDSVESGQTVASIERDFLDSEAYVETIVATDLTFDDERESVQSQNESSTDSYISEQSKRNDSTIDTSKPSVSSEDDDKVTDVEYYSHIDIDDDISEIHDTSLTEDCLNQINRGNLSTLQIVHVRSNVSQRFFNNVQTSSDQRSKRHTYSGENIEHLEITHIKNHHNQSPVRSLKSEPNLVISDVEANLVDLPEVFENQNKSYSELVSNEEDTRKNQKKRSLKRNNTVSPTIDYVDFEENVSKEKSKKKRTKSEEVENHSRKESKRRKKKHAFQETFSKSMPYLPDSKEVLNEGPCFIES